MISYLHGILAEKDKDFVVVDVNGVGYGVSVPTTVMSDLPMQGEEVILYTYLYIREDIVCLYGFDTKDSLNIFKLLITVNGIGPKGALSVLSTLSPDELRFAVLSDDSKAIAKSPGIGAKTAAKAILELKDKMDLNEALILKSENSKASKTSDNNSMVNDAIMALVALGYSNSQALAAIKECEINPDMGSDDILKIALKAIMKLGY